jgi:hypothetical protein
MRLTSKTHLDLNSSSNINSSNSSSSSSSSKESAGQHGDMRYLLLQLKGVALVVCATNVMQLYAS